MSREKLNTTGDMKEAIVQMSEGNPGAINVLIQLMKDPMEFIDILNLDDMNMRGSQIWIAYKDHCKEDIEALRKAIRDRDPEMVATVNASRGSDPDAPPAVTHGASFAHR